MDAWKRDVSFGGFKVNWKSLKSPPRGGGGGRWKGAI